MEKFLIATGKTIDLAIQAALDQLSMDRDSVSVEVLENAKSGFLGIGAQPAKVKVSYEVPDEEPKPALSSASRSKPRKEAAPAAQSADAPRVIAPAAPKQEQPRVIAPAAPQQPRPERKPRQDRAPRLERRNDRPKQDRPAREPKPAAPVEPKEYTPAEPGSMEEKIEQFVSCLRVECAGRLVCQNQLRLGDQGSGNGCPLLLSARDLIRIFVQQIFDPEPLGERQQLLPHFRIFFARQHQRQENILLQIKVVQQIKILKDKTQIFASKLCQLLILDRREALSP